MNYNIHTLIYSFFTPYGVLDDDDDGDFLALANLDDDFLFFFLAFFSFVDIFVYIIWKKIKEK